VRGHGGPVSEMLRRDDGAASVLALGLIGAVVAVTAAIVPITVAFVASQRAANAADAAALAAADAVSGALAGVPCELASRVASRNAGTLTACTVDGPIASVTVTVGEAGFTLGASARAGPPG
jgi:secretion/DNA translocation related TadE-like protein